MNALLTNLRTLQNRLLALGHGLGRVTRTLRALESAGSRTPEPSDPSEKTPQA